MQNAGPGGKPSPPGKGPPKASGRKECSTSSPFVERSKNSFLVLSLTGKLLHGHGTPPKLPVKGELCVIWLR